MLVSLFSMGLVCLSDRLHFDVQKTAKSGLHILLGGICALTVVVFFRFVSKLDPVFMFAFPMHNCI